DGGDVVVMGTGWQWRVDGCGGDVVEIKVTRWCWRGDDDGVGDGSSGSCHGGVAAGWREVAERWPEVVWCTSGWSRGGSGLDRASGVMEVAAEIWPELLGRRRNL
ncbi:hypothetical protein Tco_1400640, partial [Tanacetum coccineum]